MKLRMMAGILVAGLVGVSLGCVGGSKTEKTAAPPALAAAGGGEIGVPECDNYMAKYRACIESKVPAAAKDVVRQNLDQATSAWKQAASTPEGRGGLAQACRQATEMARTAMQAYGCSF